MTETVVELKNGEIVVDFRNRLYEIINVPVDFHEQMMCLDLMTGQRKLVWQYGINQVSKYFSLKHGNPVRFLKNHNECVKAKVIIFNSGLNFVRIDKTSEHKKLDENIYYQIRPIALNEKILSDYGFELYGNVWSDGVINLYQDEEVYQVQIISYPEKFIISGEDNYLNIIRTEHELRNVYKQNGLQKNWPL